MYENEDFDFEDMDLDEDPILEDLMEKLRRIPRNTMLVLNLPKYAEAQKAIVSLKEIAIRDYPDAEFEVEFDNLTGTSLCFRIRAFGLNVYDTEKFSSAVSIADTIDIVPLSDEEVEIGFTFRKIRIPAPPTKC